MTQYTESLARGQREHGSKWSTSALDAAPQFAPYFGTGLRIKVRTSYPGGEARIRCGTVSRTAGWQPCFLLMHRAGSIGSSDTLGPDDKIIAVKRGRQYVTLPEQEK